MLLTIESYKQTELISKFSLFYIIPKVFIVHPNSGKYIEEDENLNLKYLRFHAVLEFLVLSASLADLARSHKAMFLVSSPKCKVRPLAENVKAESKEYSESRTWRSLGHS